MAKFSVLFRRFFEKSVLAMAVIPIFLGVFNIFTDGRAGNPFTIGVILLLVIAVSCILYSFGEKMPKWCIWLMYGFVILLSALCARSVFLVGLSWDVGTVENIAKEYIEKGEYSDYYLGMYENNIPVVMSIIAIYKIAGWFGGDHHVLLYLVNWFLIASSAVMILRLIGRVFGDRGFLALYPIIVGLLVFSPYYSMYYTDTLGLFSVSILISLIYAIFENPEKKINYALLGIMMVLGYFAKVTSMIMIIALTISLISMRKPNVRKDILRLSIVGAFSLMIVMLYSFSFNRMPKFAKYSEEQLERQRFSLVHWLGMGSLRGEGLYQGCKIGTYCASYVIDMTKTESSEKRKEKAREAFRVSVSNPAKYAEFITAKIKLTFGDGSFSAWWDGDNRAINFLNNRQIDTFFRSYLGPPESAPDFAYPGPLNAGSKFLKTRKMWNLLWVSCLILIAAGIIFRLFSSKEVGILYVTLAMSVVGLAIYQVLFESRARYIYLYLPVFFMMAAYGVREIYSLMCKFKSKISGEKNA